jgi:hypothetical protein
VVGAGQAVRVESEIPNVPRDRCGVEAVDSRMNLGEGSFEGSDGTSGSSVFGVGHSHDVGAQVSGRWCMVARAPWEKLPEGVMYVLDKVGYEFGFAFAEAIGEEDRG